ncbi:MAG: DUF1385 domain-containing protein [Armatimonadota bacterium]
MSERNNRPPYGGQAIIEGVMMRGLHVFAVACRKPDGSIALDTEDLNLSWISKLSWMKRPFLRGMFALIDAMALGTKALRFSANIQLEEEAQQQDVPSKPKNAINDIAVTGTLILGLVFGMLLFVVIPTALTELLKGVIKQSLVLNLLDGIVKVIIFVAYIGLISRMAEIKRVFEYHGAEHKAINTWEAGEPLDMEHALKQTRIHPRCGTSFIVVVLMVSVVVFSFLGRPILPLRILYHLALMPVVAGISYEIIRLAGKYRQHLWARVMVAPGLASQLITTREPSEDQIEVALTALQAVVNREQTSGA